LLYASTFILFLAVFMIMYVILNTLFKNKINVKSRLEQIKELNNGLRQEDDENKSFKERALMPFYNSIGQLLLKTMTGSKIARLNKRLDRAGLLKNSSTEKWLFIKNMVALSISVLLGVLTYIIVLNIFKAFTIGILMMLFVSVAFNFSLSRKIEMRKRKILKDLPYTLDLITVSVEAGLSFDGAMARVVGNISGELCDEFAKSLKEIRMGIQRKTALRNMSERCDVKELSMLITSLIQADELGVSLGRVLRIEAANLREHRKQLAREKAMKAPVKMLFPLIFFIFPSIFIIILGPAAIKIFKVFYMR
jgi:tight adherence protein C